VTKSAVLFVDDEPGILSSVRRCLRREPYDILLAGSGTEGLEVLASKPVAVVVSDQRMPGMSGSEFLAKVQQSHPDTIRIVLTGQSDIQAAIDAVNEGGVYRYLSKPWDDAQLKTTLRDAVERFELTARNKELNELTLRQNEDLRGLAEKLRNAITESLALLTGLLELRNQTVGAHSTRVAETAGLIARELGMDETACMELTVAATLHDIGKVGMPDRILRRPAEELGKVEREMLARHAVLGEGMIRKVETFGEAAAMVRHHHERCDGGGFPDGLSRSEIPVGARVIAVADAYDRALNSRRNYRNVTPQIALARVREETPHALDPDIVATLERCLASTHEDAGQPTEIGLRVKELEAGMVLARDLKNTNGVLLLPKGTRLSESSISSLETYGGPEVLLGGVFVLREEVAADVSGARGVNNQTSLGARPH